MKKVLILVAALLVGIQAHAQFHIGVGYLNSTEITHYDKPDTKPFRETMHGFYLGGTFNIKLAGDFGIAPGFYLDMLFQEELYSEQPAYYQNRFLGGFTFKNGLYRELAFNIPVNLTYDFEINDNVRIFVYGGVVAQFAPLARTTYREGFTAPTGAIATPAGARIFYSTSGNTYKYDHLWGENPDMRPFNMYAGGGVGVQLGDIRIMAGYDHSLLNVSRIDGERTGRSQFKVGLNFLIGQD